MQNEIKIGDMFLTKYSGQYINCEVVGIKKGLLFTKYITMYCWRDGHGDSFILKNLTTNVSYEEL